MQAQIQQLYTAELPAVYGFLVRSGARHAEVEDLAHDVFLTALRKWSTFDATRPVRPWLLGIAYRVLLDLRRRASTTREVGGALPEIASEQQTGDERVQAREAQALVQEALLSLDEDRRDAFVLCDLQGLSPAEVAQTMGAPVATTYSRLRVAREEFTAAVRRIKLRRGEQ